MNDTNTPIDYGKLNGRDNKSRGHDNIDTPETADEEKYTEQEIIIRPPDVEIIESESII